MFFSFSLFVFFLFSFLVLFFSKFPFLFSRLLFTRSCQQSQRSRAIHSEIQKLNNCFINRYTLNDTMRLRHQSDMRTIQTSPPLTMYSKERHALGFGFGIINCGMQAPFLVALRLPRHSIEGSTQAGNGTLTLAVINHRAMSGGIRSELRQYQLSDRSTLGRGNHTLRTPSLSNRATKAGHRPPQVACLAAF